MCLALPTCSSCTSQWKSKSVGPWLGSFSLLWHTAPRCEGADPNHPSGITAADFFVNKLFKLRTWSLQHHSITKAWVFSGRTEIMHPMYPKAANTGKFVFKNSKLPTLQNVSWLKTLKILNSELRMNCSSHLPNRPSCNKHWRSWSPSTPPSFPSDRNRNKGWCNLNWVGGWLSNIVQLCYTNLLTLLQVNSFLKQRPEPCLFWRCYAALSPRAIVPQPPDKQVLRLPLHFPNERTVYFLRRTSFQCLKKTVEKA